MKHRNIASAVRGARTAALLLALALLGGCANPGYKEGQALVAAGNFDEALPKLAKVAKDNPDQYEYRAYYFRQRELAVAQAHAAADAARASGQLDAAEAWYRKALVYDPDNARTRSGLEEIAATRRYLETLKRAADLLERSELAGAEALVRGVLAQSPGMAQARALMRRIEDARGSADAVPSGVNSPFKRPVTLEFRDAPIRSVFETMARVAGVNFVFDKDVKADTRVTIFVRNTSIDEVMRLILTTNQLERKMLNDSSVLIYPNLPAKVREYQDLVMRTFYLVNADAKQVLAMVKALSKTRDVYVDERLNAVMVRDTPDAVRQIQKMVDAVDLPEPEVMLEIEVMEIASTRVQDLGIQLPSQITYGVPNVTTAVRYATPNGFVGTVANPVAVANFLATTTGTNTIANPRIRVRNREKAKIHIGDKLPVFTTTATANVGVSASVSYLDVGLALEIESNVYLDNEVGIKLSLEVSSVTQQVTGPSGSIAYQIGTRLANTTLRLRDGETQILAGLINDQELKNAAGVPGLGDLPVLGRLFANQTDTRNKTEVVLLITPRVLRNLNPPESASLAQSSGTDASFGAAPLRLRLAGPGSLSLQSSSGAGMQTANLEAARADTGALGPAQARRAALAARRAGISDDSAAAGAAAAPAPPEPVAANTSASPAAVSAAPAAAVAAPAGTGTGIASAETPAGSGAGTVFNTAAPPVAMSLSASGDMHTGQEFEVDVGVVSQPPAGGLQVDLAFPPDAVQPVGTTAGSQPGRVTVNLAAPGAVPVRFKALAAAGTTVSLAIAAVRGGDGTAVQYLAPNPVALVITP
jgi:general secretion pathway protein D